MTGWNQSLELKKSESVTINLYLQTGSDFQQLALIYPICKWGVGGGGGGGCSVM